MNKAEKINEKLREAQTEWVNHIKYEGTKELREFKMLTHPFYFGISEKYVDSKRKIMVVGQEVRVGNEKSLNKGEAVGGWGFLNNSLNGEHGYDGLTAKINKHETSQQWAIDMCDVQLFEGVKRKYYKIEKDKIVMDKIEKDTGAFWNFMRYLKEAGGITPCWNNVDKILFNATPKGEKGITLKTRKQHYKEEYFLSAPYPHGKESASLLKREIDILRSHNMVDAVLFACGSPYYVSLATAFGIDEEELQRVENKPDWSSKKTAGKRFVDISEKFDWEIPVFWSCHPRCFSEKEKKNLIESIKRKV